MVTGFIAVGILSHQPCDVGLDATCCLNWSCEQGLETGEISFVAAQDPSLPAHVMDRRKEVLPSIRLCEVKFTSLGSNLEPKLLVFWAG